MSTKGVSQVICSPRLEPVTCTDPALSSHWFIALLASAVIGQRKYTALVFGVFRHSFIRLRFGKWLEKILYRCEYCKIMLTFDA